MKQYKDPIINRDKQNKIILFTNVRNELNMKEWCAHHLLLGFDYICIFDHKSDIPLQKQDFSKRVSIIRCNLPNPVKIPLMKQAVNIAKQINADWMLYLDADEFLVINAFYNIKHMLHVFRNADSLSINWLMFGSNNHIKTPPGFIIENYTKSDLHLNKHVKSFVRPRCVTNVTNPHYYIITNYLRRMSVQNRVMDNIKPEFYEGKSLIEYNKAPAFIAHYIYQSEENYINRKLKLPCDDTNTFRQKDNNIHDKHNNVDNEFVKNKYLTKIQDYLSSS